MDAGSGVETAIVEIDGQATELAVGGANCRRHFVLVDPCAADSVISLDDLGLAEGEHSVFATLIDAAGNRGYAGPFIVRMPGPSEASAQVRRVVGTVIVDGPATRRTGYQALTVTGIVRDLEGFPIPRATVVVTTRVPGREWAPGGEVQTDAKGRFVLRLAKGPTREVRLSYSGSASTLRFNVAAPIRLTTNRKTTRNGRTIKFRGRIPDAATSQTRVTLQAWASGKWMPFRTVQLRKGRFSARYRFSGTFRTQRYRFRAVVGKDPSLPYESGRSPVVTVVVRGAAV
jgi:hypothetical protein